MKLKLLKFMIIILHIETRRCQQLSPSEMRYVKSHANLHFKKYPEECDAALNGTLYPEVPYVYYWCSADQTNRSLFNDADLTYCSGFDCWESQLTDVSRIEILKIMNTYRQRVAENRCKKWCKRNKLRSIMQLRWDENNEFAGLSYVARCHYGKKRFEQKNVIVDNPSVQNKNWTAEFVSVSFEVVTGFQREMREILGELISENHLLDWDEKTSNFRRGQMVDVGCVYTLRRNVSVVTSLGEHVKSGRVGYLTCVFTTPLESLIQPDAIDGDIKCVDLIPSFSEFMMNDDNDYYPNLCKIRLDLTVLRFNTRCYLPQRNYCTLSSYSFNPETILEQHYGLTIKTTSTNTGDEMVEADVWRAECVVPKNIPTGRKEGKNIYNFNCTARYNVYIIADPKLCSHWYCEDSQLTDYTKLDILKSLNTARQVVATSGCSQYCTTPCPYCSKSQFCNMANLRWHWFLEKKASSFVRNCFDGYSFQEEMFDDEPFRRQVIYERIDLVLDLPSNKGQTALGEIFSTLFWKNAFHDWSKDNKFRRGNALWIGCAIIQRPGVTLKNMKSDMKLNFGIPTHLTCIYAAMNPDFFSKIGTPGSCCQTCGDFSETRPCEVNLVPGLSPFPYLCTSVLLEVTLPCGGNPCAGPTKRSLAWRTTYAGVTAIQLPNGSYAANCRVENIPAPEPISSCKVWIIKYCWILWIILMMLISMVILVLSLFYKHYSREKSYRKKISLELGRKLKKRSKAKRSTKK